MGALCLYFENQNPFFSFLFISEGGGGIFPLFSLLLFYFVYMCVFFLINANMDGMQ